MHPKYIFIMTGKHLLLTIVFMLLCNYGFGQNTTKAYKDIGETFYEKEVYTEALDAFLRYHKRKPGDIDVKKKIGVCYFHTNNTAQAKKFLNYVIENDKKIDPEVLLYLAKANHRESKFKEGISFYKEFLRKVKSNDGRRSAVKDAIKRASNGMKYVAREQNIIVENMGENINTPMDEFCPVLSPNYDNRIYFSSVRKGNLGGKRNNKGHIDKKFGRFASDMFVSSKLNGEWGNTTAMNSMLNSPRNEMILDFNSNGTVMYFFKGFTRFSGDVLVDTFKAGQEKSYIHSKFISPALTEEGDANIYFYNDTIMLFSSRRPEGYGGKDIYITTFRNGRWTKGQNLGPNVNSAYDEICPFLCKDGRTLYFSSNNRNKSVGGYDIMKAYFNDKTVSWNEAKNMAFPVNSPSDDLYFKMSKDGLSGYFSSDRKEGLGGEDLYIAYFKTPQKEQQRFSNPIVFSMLGEQSSEYFTKNTSISSTGSSNKIDYSEEEIKDYTISPLLYVTNDDILSSKNRGKLNPLIELMQKYPQVKMNIISNSEVTGPQKFDLYFSIKRAEIVMTYLEQHGIDPARINIQGCGANYPVAHNELDNRPNPAGQKLNRHITFSFYNTDDLPVRIEIRDLNVPVHMQDFKHRFFTESMKGLAYKVQVAAIKSMYDSDVIARFQDPMVELNFGSPIYRYSVGLYQTYNSADQLKQELMRSGIEGAFVVPYIDGLRVSKSEISAYEVLYPDLRNYLVGTSKN